MNHKHISKSKDPCLIATKVAWTNTVDKCMMHWILEEALSDTQVKSQKKHFMCTWMQKCSVSGDICSKLKVIVHVCLWFNMVYRSYARNIAQPKATPLALEAVRLYLLTKIFKSKHILPCQELEMICISIQISNAWFNAFVMIRYVSLRSCAGAPDVIRGVGILPLCQRTWGAGVACTGDTGRLLPWIVEPKACRPAAGILCTIDIESLSEATYPNVPDGLPQYWLLDPPMLSSKQRWILCS